MEVNKQTMRDWAQAYKKQIAVGITITVAVVALYMGIKNANKIEEALISLPKAFEKAPPKVTDKVTPQVSLPKQIIAKQSVSISESAVNLAKPVLDAAQKGIEEVISSVPPIVEKLPEPFLPPHIIDNLTGTQMTATQLGRIVGCSNREINKRIVAAGLAIKCLDGEYMRTKLGEQLGKDTWKVTKAGHSFSNIEWDTVVLKIICTPEELELQSVKGALEKELLSA